MLTLVQSLWALKPRALTPTIQQASWSSMCMLFLRAEAGVHPSTHMASHLFVVSRWGSTLPPGCQAGGGCSQGQAAQHR